MRRSLFVLVAGLLIANSAIKMPFADSAVSGFDRPWMYQMQMRLMGINWLDFSAPFENAIFQVAAHHGQAELLPMFVAIGVNRLLGIPQTAVNIQWAYVLLDAVVLLVVLALARQVSGSRGAALLAGAMYASYPMLAYVTMFPLQTNYTNLLVAAIVLLWIRYERSRTWRPAVAAGILAFVLQVSSRLAMLDAIFLLLLYGAVLVSGYRTVRGSMPLRRWVRQEVWTGSSALLAGIVLGIAVNSYIYWFGVHADYPVFGIYSYSLNHRRIREGLGLLDSVKYVGTMASYNGLVLYALSLAMALAAPVIWWRAGITASFARIVAWFWFAFYFLPAFFLRRWDYHEIYFIPMILLSVDILRTMYSRAGIFVRPVVTAAVAACLAVNVLWVMETVRNVQVTGVPYRISRAWTAAPQEWAQWGIHPYYWIIGSLNADYHLKATGYWIRKHAPPESSVVLLCGNVSHKATAEYYFGTPFINASRPARKRLYYVTEPRLKAIVDADLAVERQNPNAFIKGKLLAMEGYGFPLDGVENFFVVLIHPLDVVTEAGGMTFAAAANCAEGARSVLPAKLFKAGEIVNARGEPEVTIYSFLEGPFRPYTEEAAKRAFDEEFATWEHLWGHNYFAQMDTFFSGD